MDERNKEYLSGAFKALRAAGVRTLDEAKEADNAFIESRKLLRESLGTKYDTTVSDYKKMIQETAHRFKVNVLVAADHCIKSLYQETAPYMTEEEKIKAVTLFMAAALDIIEPEIGRN